MSQTMKYAQNMIFLTNLLADENKCMIPMDFVDNTDPKILYMSNIFIMAFAYNYKIIREKLNESIDNFISYIFDLYVEVFNNYKLSGIKTEISMDDAQIFYPITLIKTTCQNLVSVEINREMFNNYLNCIRDNHSFVVIKREISSFICIHHQNNDYIVIDTGIECCGILSQASIYKYVVYDGAWDFSVDLLTNPDKDLIDNISNEIQNEQPIITVSSNIPIESVQSNYSGVIINNISDGDLLEQLDAQLPNQTSFNEINLMNNNNNNNNNNMQFQSLTNDNIMNVVNSFEKLNNNEQRTLMEMLLNKLS
jgi:hypothetical protein